MNTCDVFDEIVVNAKFSQIEVTTCEYKTFKELNNEWHSRLPSVGGFYIKGTYFLCHIDGVPIAVAGWSKPIARAFNGKPYMELRRMAIRDSAPRNTATFMLARMRKWFLENMPEIETLISYQDESVHNGTIYKADNWVAAYKRYRGAEKGWKNHIRSGGETVTTDSKGNNSAKIRWEYKLK